jgi:hypothetical protein
LEKKKAAAGKKIAKEVEKGVAKALMEKELRCCSCNKEDEESYFLPLTAPWCSNKKRKRRSEWDDEHIATEQRTVFPPIPPSTTREMTDHPRP